MSARAYKAGLLASAVVLLGLVSRFQGSLNQQRAQPELGLTRGVGLGSNAPPVLAFTTVALGGFRGLIANALWIRANDLQQDGKYFEMVQLADWITKLEPGLAQVWVIQAWNMAFNISVKFPNPYDRWRWVRRGIELLRDEGLRYNPREALIYRELAWFFQFKMGQNMDDAHMVYKQEWAKEMNTLLGSGRPDFKELIHPTTDDSRARAQRLREYYRMDARKMKEADETFGPLEWRLPEAHAIYWAHVGLGESKKKDLITLRRVVYQPMHMSVLRGRLMSINQRRFGPALTKIEQANSAYELMIKDDVEMRDAIKRAHRNFLKELVYVLYANNKLADAARWFKSIREQYPDSFPPGQTLDDYALQRIAGNLQELPHDRTKAILEGLIGQYYSHLAADDDDRTLGFELVARKLWNAYAENIKGQTQRLTMPPFHN